MSVVETVLEISRTKDLKDFRGLENLTQVGWLHIYENEALQNLDALDPTLSGSLAVVTNEYPSSYRYGSNAVEIYDNTTLLDCAGLSLGRNILAQGLSDDFSINVYDNRACGAGLACVGAVCE